MRRWAHLLSGVNGPTGRPLGTPCEPIKGQQQLLIDAPGLLALADLISPLKHKN
jgi:hypothetical protein